jgi:hypothetical protein
MREPFIPKIVPISCKAPVNIGPWGVNESADGIEYKNLNNVIIAITNNINTNNIIPMYKSI